MIYIILSPLKRSRYNSYDVKLLATSSFVEGLFSFLQDRLKTDGFFRQAHRTPLTVILLLTLNIDSDI